MAKFTDSLERDWDVHITAGDLKRIRKDVGVDLRDALRPDGGELIKALDDNDRFLDLMWALCREQACKVFAVPLEFELDDGEGNPVKVKLFARSQFERLFDRDTGTNAVVAVWEAVWDFSRGQKVGQEAKAALLASSETVENATLRFLQSATQRIRNGPTSNASVNGSAASPPSTIEPSPSPN